MNNKIKTVGIIGAGMIGGQVARLSVAADLNVIICNSRSPETLEPLIKELGSRARAATLNEVIDGSDIVVAAVPFFTYSKLPVAALAGKVVVDTMNYYPERDGEMSEVQTDKIATSELVQHHLVGARLVKGINNMDWIRLFESARKHGDASRSAMPIASNDNEAKQLVATFLDLIGYDFVDMGNLSESWRSEPTMPAYVLPYLATAPSGFAPETFRKIPGATVTKGRVQSLLSQAVRHDKMFGSLK